MYIDCLTKAGLNRYFIQDLQHNSVVILRHFCGISAAFLRLFCDFSAATSNIQPHQVLLLLTHLAFTSAPLEERLLEMLGIPGTDYYYCGGNWHLLLFDDY